MSNTKKAIRGDITAMKFIKEFVIANEEIAAINMRKIRNAVVNRRDFVAELTQLYNEVKLNYKKELERLLSGRRGNKSSLINLIRKNDKTALVLLSTNTSLFGDIVKNTYVLFKEYFEREKCDAVIVGRTGKSIFTADKPGVPFSYFDFPDTYLDNKLLKAIVMDIIQYQKVIIFHSKFQTLLSQTPTAFTISEIQQDRPNSAPQLKYIFEPSLEKIIEFFEKEIFSTIFEQVMHESHLSKFASRMVTLDKTTLNINKGLTGLYKKQRILQHEMSNKQQVNMVARMIMWSRRPA